MYRRGTSQEDVNFRESTLYNVRRRLFAFLDAHGRIFAYKCVRRLTADVDLALRAATPATFSLPDKGILVVSTHIAD